MIIAIDYDGTITEDRVLFKDIVQLMKSRGHNPIIVTMRYEHEEDNFLNAVRSLDGWNVRVYYTGRKAKRDYLEALNILPDVWIDDNPEWIFSDSL